MTDDDPCTLSAATEQPRVEGWRLEELLRAGYPVDLAGLIAERADVDLHEAIALVRRGCSPRLAVEILL